MSRLLVEKFAKKGGLNGRYICRARNWSTAGEKNALRGGLAGVARPSPFAAVVRRALRARAALVCCVLARPPSPSAAPLMRRRCRRWGLAALRRGSAPSLLALGLSGVLPPGARFALRPGLAAASSGSACGAFSLCVGEVWRFRSRGPPPSCGGVARCRSSASPPWPAPTSRVPSVCAPLRCAPGRLPPALARGGQQATPAGLASSARGAFRPGSRVWVCGRLRCAARPVRFAALASASRLRAPPLPRRARARCAARSRRLVLPLRLRRWVRPSGRL